MSSLFLFTFIFYLPTITEAPTENPLITLPMQITIKISEAVNENPTIETNVNKIKDNFLPIPFIRKPNNDYLDISKSVK